MSRYDTDNTLLFEMLGKGGGTEVFTTAAQTGKDFYCVHFPVESVITTIAGDASSIGKSRWKNNGGWNYLVSTNYSNKFSEWCWNRL